MTKEIIKETPMSELVREVKRLDYWDEDIIRELCNRCEIGMTGDLENDFNRCEYCIESELLERMSDEELMAEIDRCGDWGDAEPYLDELMYRNGIDKELLDTDEEYRAKMAERFGCISSEIDCDYIYVSIKKGDC